MKRKETQCQGCHEIFVMDTRRKYCSSCRSQCPDHATRKDPYCLTCKAVHSLKRRESGMATRARYNLSDEQSARLSSTTHCECCGHRGDLVVDHDHSCCPGVYACGKCIRGFICHSCNRALGHARDDIARIEAMATYLKRSVMA